MSYSKVHRLVSLFAISLFFGYSCTDSEPSKTVSVMTPKQGMYFMEFATNEVKGIVDTVYSLIINLDSPNSMYLRFDPRNGIDIKAYRKRYSAKYGVVEKVKISYLSVREGRYDRSLKTKDDSISFDETRSSISAASGGISAEYLLWYAADGKFIANRLNDEQRIKELIRFFKKRLKGRDFQWTTIQSQVDSIQFSNFR